MPIRPSTEHDLAAIADIYRHHVLHGTATFETEPPTATQMAARRHEVLGKNLPWLVAEIQGRVVGYAYANWFRPREAFRYCAEDSIYLADGYRSQGLGSALLIELMAQCEAIGMRKMIAVIGDSGNVASIALHQRLGFAQASIMQACGWKFNRWIDIVMMERTLGAGASTPAN